MFNNIQKSKEKDKKILQKLTNPTKARSNFLSDYLPDNSVQGEYLAVLVKDDKLYAYDGKKKVVIDDKKVLESKKVITHDDYSLKCFWNTRIIGRIIDYDADFSAVKTPEDIYKLFYYQKDALKNVIFNNKQRLETLNREMKVANIAKDIQNRWFKYTLDTFAAKSGRMHSRQPNLMSYTTEERKKLVSKDGYCYISSDFSAQEPRILAFLANETSMHDSDIYAAIASKLFNVKYEECLGKSNSYRSKAKTALFSIMYGKGDEDFFKHYPKVKEFIDRAKNTSAYVETIYGRKIKAGKNNVNLIIQGSAADMLKNTIIRVEEDEELKKLGYEILLPIHDELLGHCPVENAENCAARVKYLMENIDDRLKMKVETKIMSTWE